MTTDQSRQPHPRGRRRAIALGQIFLFSAVHFVLAIGTALIGYGLDMDQLRSRSVASRIGAAISETLMYPHDLALRQVPNAWLIRNLWIIPAALFTHTLLWGVFLFVCREVWRRRERSAAEVKV